MSETGGGSRFDQRGSTFAGGVFGNHNSVVQGYGAAGPPGPTPQRVRAEKVVVAHGRDEQARLAVFGFLRDLGLEPLEWETRSRDTGNAAPYVLEVVQAGFAAAGAAIVLLTPDDFAVLHPRLREPSDLAYEREPTGQPRQNVLIEAGMALALHPGRTIILQIGRVRPMSNLAGVDFVQITTDRPAEHAEKLANIAARLRAAGCRVIENWRDTGRFRDLDALQRTL